MRRGLPTRRAAPLGVRLAALGLAASLCAAPGLAQAPGARAPAAPANQPGEQGVLAGFISRALSTSASRVRIGDIEGALSSDATVRDLTISDREGVWLRLDRARLVWTRSALLARRLEIDRLEVGRLEVLRRPLPEDEPVPGAEEPLLPELPVKVRVERFTLSELLLAEPVVGTAARVAADGTASLGAPSEGLALRFDARRLDAPGALGARLSLVPDTGALTLDVKLQEPEGGLLARAIDLPGLPPVALDLAGTGTLDAFASTLAFDAGPTIGARGSARLARVGPARRLGLDLTARVAGLLPALAAPVFGGETRLDGTVAFVDDGSVGIERLGVLAAAARLDVSGRVAPDGGLDLKVSAASVPNAGGGTEAGVAALRRLAFDATVRGPPRAPLLDATLAVEDARGPLGRLSRLDAAFTARPGPAPAGAAPDAAVPVALRGEARASGLAPADPALARALGDGLTASLSGTLGPDGAGDFDAIRVDAAGLSLTYAGRLGARALRGRLEASAPDLARFGPLAGLALSGSARLGADLDGAPAQRALTARIDAAGARVATGIAPVDRLFGEAPTLRGTARRLPTGVAFEAMTLQGPHAAATLNGRADAATADLVARLAVPDLARADPRLTGRGEALARLTGSLARPGAEGEARLIGATMLGRQVPRLALAGRASDLFGALDAAVTLEGEVDAKPAAGRLRLRRPLEGGTRIDDLDVGLGSARVAGDLALDAAGLASGRLSARAGDLADLSALALSELSGRLEAEAVLAATGGGQDLRATLDARGLRGPGFAVDRLSGRAAASDLYRRPALDADLALERARVGDEVIERARVLAAPGPGGASDVTVTANARGVDVDAAGRVVPGAPTRVEVARLAARRGAARLALVGPASATLEDGGARLTGVALALGTGRLTASGVIGPRLDLALAARAVPLSALDALAPGLDLAGTLDGEARVAGPAGAPRGDYALRLARFSAPALRAAGLPPLDASARGRLEDGRATLDAGVRGGAPVALTVTGSLPLGAGALDLTARGRLDAGLANAALGAGGRRLAGAVALDARVTGTAAAPRAEGSATLTGGAFRDAEAGLALDGLAARVLLRGEEAVLERLSATTPGGGTLGVTGRARIDPAAGFPGTLRVTGRRAQLVANGVVTAVADLALDVTGPLARLPRVAGTVGVVSLDVAIPDRLPGTQAPLEGTRHLNPTPTTRARLGKRERAARGGRAPPPFDAALAITLTAPGGVTVHGKGLDAELGGRVAIGGTLAKPTAQGAFALRRGRFDLLGSRLDFTRGTLTFGGDLTPELDFLAEAGTGDGTARVAVTGPASAPDVSFTSDGGLPQDEVLARLLFGRASGSLSPFQALQLAGAAAQFSGGGGGGGGGAFEGLRRDLGLGGAQVGGGTSPGLLGKAERALGGRANVGVKAGGSAGDTGVGASVDLGRRLKLNADVGVDGRASVGVGAEWEY